MSQQIGEIDGQLIEWKIIIVISRRFDGFVFLVSILFIFSRRKTNEWSFSI